MRSGRGSDRSLPNTRKLTIIAQDPSIRLHGRIVTAEVDVPAEELLPGPCGYRVNVVDYDSSLNTLYKQAVFRGSKHSEYEDPFRVGSERSASYDRKLLTNPTF